MRRFNRSYTRRIGVLEERHPESPYTLGEARVLYELAQREGASASALARELGLDAGHLSRILPGLREGGLVDRRASEEEPHEQFGHDLVAQTWELRL